MYEFAKVYLVITSAASAIASYLLLTPDGLATSGFVLLLSAVGDARRYIFSSQVKRDRASDAEHYSS